MNLESLCPKKGDGWLTSSMEISTRPLVGSFDGDWWALNNLSKKIDTRVQPMIKGAIVPVQPVVALDLETRNLP